MIATYTQLCLQSEQVLVIARQAALQEKLDNVLDLLGESDSDDLSDGGSSDGYGAGYGQMLQVQQDEGGDAHITTHAIVMRLVGNDVRHVHEFFDVLRRRGGPLNPLASYAPCTRNALIRLVCSSRAALSYPRLDQLLLPAAGASMPATLFSPLSLPLPASSLSVPVPVPPVSVWGPALHVLRHWLNGSAAPTAGSARHQAVLRELQQGRGGGGRGSGLDEQRSGVPSSSGVWTSLHQIALTAASAAADDDASGADDIALDPALLAALSEPEPPRWGRRGAGAGVPAEPELQLQHSTHKRSRQEEGEGGVSAGRDQGIEKERAREGEGEREGDTRQQKAARATHSAGSADLATFRASATAAAAATATAVAATVDTVLAACRAVRASMQRASAGGGAAAAGRQVPALAAAVAGTLTAVAEAEAEAGTDTSASTARSVLRARCLLALGLWLTSDEVLLATVQALTAGGVRASGVPLRLLLLGGVLLKLRAQKGSAPVSRVLLRALETAAAARPKLVALCVLARAPRLPASCDTLRLAWNDYAKIANIKAELYQNTASTSATAVIAPSRASALELLLRSARQGHALPADLINTVLAGLLGYARSAFHGIDVSFGTGQGVLGGGGLGASEEEDEDCLLDALLSPLVSAPGLSALALAPAVQDGISGNVWSALLRKNSNLRMFPGNPITRDLQWDAEVARTIRTLLQPAPSLSGLVLQALVTGAAIALNAASADALPALCEATAALLATLVSKYRTQLMESGAQVELRAVLQRCGTDVVVRSALNALDRSY